MGCAGSRNVNKNVSVNSPHELERGGVKQGPQSVGEIDPLHLKAPVPNISKEEDEEVIENEKELASEKRPLPSITPQTVSHDNQQQQQQPQHQGVY